MNFLKASKLLHLKVQQRQRKKVAKTSKCDGVAVSRISQIHRLMKKPDKLHHSSIKPSEIFELWELNRYNTLKSSSFCCS